MTTETVVSIRSAFVATSSHALDLGCTRRPRPWLLVSCILAFGVSQIAMGSTLTERNSAARTGEYNDSTGNLDPAYVKFGQFGFLWKYPVDGFVYAQPLTVDAVGVAGGPKNVVYIATNNNSVYAFDADANPPIGTNPTPIWHWAASGNPPMDQTVNNCGYGGQFRFGILSTPTIAGTTMFVVAESAPAVNPCAYAHTLYALNIVTGAQLASIPIAASAPGASGTTINFQSTKQIQRPSLLYQNGTLYVGFGGDNDQFDFYGWVLQFSFNGVAFSQTGAYCSTCATVTPGTAGGGSVWQSGSGLVGDPAGNVYFMTGNGESPVASQQESFVKLVANPLSVQSYIEPNWSALDLADLDLGSAGPILVPDPALPSNNLLIGGGKEGKISVISPSLMQEFSNKFTVNSTSILGSPVYWAEQNRLYVWAMGGPLSVASISAEALGSWQTSSVPTPYGIGGLLSLSRNALNGKGIIWAAVRAEPDSAGDTSEAPSAWDPNTNSGVQGGHGILRAIDATTLQPLWNSGPFVEPKFPVVTPAYGRVYVPTFGTQVVKEIFAPVWVPTGYAVNVYGRRTLPPPSGVALTGPSSWASIPIAYSSGDGNFSVTNQSAQPFASWASATGTIKLQGDFDGDGKSDIALDGVAAWTSLPVALARGSGTFSIQNPQLSPSTFDAWSAAPSVSLVGDFDHSGTSDIAVFRTANNPLAFIPVASSHWANPNLTFTVTTQAVVDPGGKFMGLSAYSSVTKVVGNFGGDNKDDIALIGAYCVDSTQTGIPVAVSTGGGNFTVSNYTLSDPSFASYACATGVSRFVADFNGDGLPDIALVGGSGWTSIPVAINNGVGSFAVHNVPNVSNSFGAWASSAGVTRVVGDFNGDGKADIALTGVCGWNSIPVAFSKGDGSFTGTNGPPVTPAWTTSPVCGSTSGWGAMASTTGVEILTGDFNADGLTDIALTGPSSWTTIPVAFSDGDGSFMATSATVSGFPTYAGVSGAVPLVGHY